MKLTPTKLTPTRKRLNTTAAASRSAVRDRALDEAILTVIRKRGPQLGIELLGEVEAAPRQVVDRLQELVARDVLRHGPDRRFSLRAMS